MYLIYLLVNATKRIVKITANKMGTQIADVVMYFKNITGLPN